MELAPAYDVTHAYRPDSRVDEPASHGGERQVRGHQHRGPLRVGDRNDVPGYRRVVREVRAAVDEWAGFAATAEIDDDTIKMVAADIERFRAGASPVRIVSTGQELAGFERTGGRRALHQEEGATATRFQSDRSEGGVTARDSLAMSTG